MLHSGLTPPARRGSWTHELADSQSSSSGCVGASPRRPKSPGVPTSAFAEVVHPDAVDEHAGRQRVVLRRRSRGPVRAGRCRLANGLRLVLAIFTNCRGTGSPGRPGWPRSKTRGSYGPRRIVQHHRPRRALREPAFERPCRSFSYCALRRAIGEEREEAPVERERRVGRRIAGRRARGGAPPRRDQRASLRRLSFHCLSTSASNLP